MAAEQRATDRGKGSTRDAECDVPDLKLGLVVEHRGQQRREDRNRRSEGSGRGRGRLAVSPAINECQRVALGVVQRVVLGIDGDTPDSVIRQPPSRTHRPDRREWALPCPRARQAPDCNRPSTPRSDDLDATRGHRKVAATSAEIGVSPAGDDFELGQEFAKAAIGSAMNLVVPGLGSLAAGAVDVRRSVSAELAKELGNAIVDVRRKTPKRSRGLRRIVDLGTDRLRQRKAIKSLRGELTYESLLHSALAQFDEAPDAEDGHTEGHPQPALAEVLEPATPDTLASLARVQLTLSQSPALGTQRWRDGLESTLRMVATAGLTDGKRRDGWLTLIAPGDPQATATDVADWSAVVSRAFAARLAGATGPLQNVMKELDEHDRRASNEALLIALDSQRRALQFMAYALVLIAGAVGADVTGIA